MATQKRGLGRGLDALIPQTSAAVINPPATGLVEIDPKAIGPNPEQPRQEFDEDEIVRLANSISLYGLLHPIVVENIGGAYRLVAGERRLRACQRLGLTSIPAIVRPTSARRESLELALTENMFRSNLSAIEEASAYNRLAETFGLSHDTIATRLGKSRSTITNTIRLLNLPAPVQQAIKDGQLTAGHGRAILALPSEEEQVAFAERIIQNSWSVRETEEYVQHPPEPASSDLSSDPVKQNQAPRSKDPVSVEDATYIHALETVVGMPVSLRRTRKGGYLVLRFTDNDDLSTLYNRLGGPPL
ncbi:MAG: ParB/RepB/Spo0J family partition protein [Candidatus Dormibacteria bacterium]